MNLELEQVNALTPDDRNRYMQLEKLFNQPGWKYVTALAQRNAALALQNAALAATWDTNRMQIGNHMAWLSIANLEKDTQSHYGELSAKALMGRELSQLSEESDFE